MSSHSFRLRRFTSPILASLVVLAGFVAPAPAARSEEFRSCGIAIECGIAVMPFSQKVTANFAFSSADATRLGLYGSEIVITESVVERGFLEYVFDSGLWIEALGNFVASLLGQEPSKSRQVAVLKAKHNVRAAGGVIFYGDWVPKGGWTSIRKDRIYAAALLRPNKDGSKTEFAATVLTPDVELSPGCALVAGALMTTRDTAKGTLDAFALTGSIIEIASGALPRDLEAKFAKSNALKFSGYASFAITSVDAWANGSKGEVAQVAVEFIATEAEGVLVDQLPVNERIAGKILLSRESAEDLAVFISEQGAKNGDAIFEMCA